MTNSTAVSFLPGIDALERENAALVEKQTELEASVAQQIADIKTRRAENLDTIGTAVIAALAADGLSLLVNPDTAAEVYRLGWESSHGKRPFLDAFHAAVGLPAVAPHGYWMFGDPTDSDYTAKHPVLQMFVPFNDQTPVKHIEDISSNIQQVFEAQEDILDEFGYAPSIICGWRDGRDLRISRDDNSENFVFYWTGLLYSTQTFESLSDALIAASRTEGLVNSFN